jgi:hypothetical protein
LSYLSDDAHDGALPGDFDGVKNYSHRAPETQRLRTAFEFCRRTLFEALLDFRDGGDQNDDAGDVDDCHGDPLTVPAAPPSTVLAVADMP